MPNIENNITAVQRRLQQAARDAGRNPDDILLLAVSKTRTSAQVNLAHQAGINSFGENYLQEALDKIELLKSQSLDWHFIGPLQSNKARAALQLFDCIHTLDRPKLATTFARLAQELGHCPPMFAQVNTGLEDQKAGIVPDSVDDFVATCRALDLPVAGLMCIPPVDEEASMHFALLAKLAKRNDLAQLSMGMSGDFAKAISFGATHVRVGSAIFGARISPPAAAPSE